MKKKVTKRNVAKQNNVKGNTAKQKNVKTTVAKQEGTKKNIIFRRGFHKIRGMFHRGHPGYVFDKERDNYILLGFTHDEKKKNDKNYFKLERNPDPKDKKGAYMSKKVSFSNCIGEQLNNYSFTEKDKGKVEKIIEKYYKKKKR